MTPARTANRLTGAVRLNLNYPARPDAFLAAVAPFRHDRVVASECIHCWYWLADLCRKENIPLANCQQWKFGTPFKQ